MEMFAHLYIGIDMCGHGDKTMCHKAMSKITEIREAYIKKMN